MLCHRIPNLEPLKAEAGQSPSVPEGLQLTVVARSVLPQVHFELAASDYLSSGRRNPELRGPHGQPPGARLDLATRVIEVEAIGLQDSITKRFTVVNPTKEAYHFQWVNDDDDDVKRRRCFQCLVQSDLIQAGTKRDCGFKFTSAAVGVCESFWRFEVPELGLSVPFLLVGNTHEPLVSFDRARISFKPLLIGHETIGVANIVNEENRAFDFEVDPSSLLLPAEDGLLEVDPMRGTVPAKSKLPVHFHFRPIGTNEVCFHVSARVARKPEPLGISVKGIGYKIEATILLEDQQGNLSELNELQHLSPVGQRARRRKRVRVDGATSEDKDQELIVPLEDPDPAPVVVLQNLELGDVHCSINFWRAFL